MEPNLQKSDDDACGNRSHPPPLRDSGYDGGRELSGEGGEPSPPPRGGGASDGFTDLFYGRGIGNTNPQHRQKLWPFPKISEPACCKYLVYVIEYTRHYLLGVFFQWTPERWLSSLLYSTCPLESRSYPFIPVPLNSSFAWRVMLQARCVQSVTSLRLASTGTTRERLPICPVRVVTCC